MSFIYPRVVEVKRPKTLGGVGAVGYGGISPDTDTSPNGANSKPLKGLQASIQLHNTGAQIPVKLPADVMGKPLWKILIPCGLNGLSLGDILDRDVIVDELGNRYQVASAYWASGLSYDLWCEKLEA